MPMSDSLPKNKRLRKVYTKSKKRKKTAAKISRPPKKNDWHQSILPCFDCPWLDPNPPAADLDMSAKMSLAECLGLMDMLNL